MKFWEVVLYVCLVLSLILQNARLIITRTYQQQTIDRQEEIIESQGLRIQKLDELNHFITKPPC